MADRRDQQLAVILREGWPEPRPGIEARLQAALAGVRPRRHPNLVAAVVLVLVLLLLASMVLAAVRYFLRPGTLEFTDSSFGTGSTWVRAHALSGELEWVSEAKAGFTPSPRFGRRAWVVAPPDGIGPWSRHSDIYVSDPDGQNAVNATGRAGIGGVNCGESWSPDDTKIAFHHSEPKKGQKACDPGWQIWVMNADGANAHRVTPEGYPSSSPMAWLPDGSHLLIVVRPGEGEARATDLWGRDIRPVPNVGHNAAISPDGSLIASSTFVWRQGRSPGVVRSLVITAADGSDPRVAAQQFVKGADIREHIARQASNKTQDPDLRKMNRAQAREEIRYYVGPKDPVWSPDGTKVAFLAAMPFDPRGIFYRDQIEVWVYDLRTRKSTRITHDNVSHGGLHWKAQRSSGPAARSGTTGDGSVGTK